MKKMENQPNQTMDRRCRRTKQAISNAMLELIQEKPLSSITVSELADRADINRKTFYKHYHDTMAVLDEIEDRIVEKIFSNLNRENVLLDIEDPYPFLCRIGEGMRGGGTAYEDSDRCRAGNPDYSEARSNGGPGCLTVFCSTIR